MIAKVQEWLETQGYSLEMKTASAFRAARFEVRQSTYYTDAETKKAREIDVQAIDRSLHGLVDIRFIVECKSGDKPWVLFSSPDALNNYDRLFAFAAMSKHAREFFSLERIELLTKYPWFMKDGVIAGYSMRQAFSKEVDSAYAAVMSVTNACHHHVHVKEDKSRIPRLHFAFPLIVVDTPLIRCFLDENGRVQLQEVEEGELLFTAHLGTCIRIVTQRSLPAFATQAKHVAEMLMIDLRDEEKKFFDAIKPKQ